MENEVKQLSFEELRQKELDRVHGERYPDEKNYPHYTNFGDVARGKLGQQSQYASRYLDGWCEGFPNLGEGIRYIGSTSDYHHILIHKHDVKEFVNRVKKYRGD